MDDVVIEERFMYRLSKLSGAEHKKDLPSKSYQSCVTMLKKDLPSKSDQSCVIMLKKDFPSKSDQSCATDDTEE